MNGTQGSPAGPMSAQTKSATRQSGIGSRKTKQGRGIEMAEDESKLTFKAKWALDRIEEEAQELRAEMERLEDALDQRTGVVRKLIACPLRKIVYQTHPNEHGSPENAKRAAQQAYALAAPIHEQNVAIASENKRILIQLAELIKNAGIESTYSVREGSGRRMKWVSHQCQWDAALRQNVQVTDEWDDTVRRYNQWIKDRDAEIAKVKADAEAKSRALAQEEEALKGKLVVAKIAEKYGLPITSSADDVQSAIREKDKYLDLADGMYATRCDWNEGPWYAKNALQRFKIENATDQAIYDDNWPAVEDWDGDGRVFRDGKWGYDAVFALADPMLLSDYQAVAPFARR